MTGTQTAIALIIAFLGLSLPFMLPHLIAKAVGSLIGWAIALPIRIVCALYGAVTHRAPVSAALGEALAALAELVTVVSWGWAAWRTVVLSSRHWAAWKAGGSTQVIVLGVVGAVSLIVASYAGPGPMPPWMSAMPKWRTRRRCSGSFVFIAASRTKACSELR